MINHEQAAELREQLQAKQAMRLQQAIAALHETDAMKVLMKRSEAARKQAEASALLDEADRMEAEAEIRGEIDELSKALPPLQEGLTRCTGELKQAQEAEGAAAKRLLKVREAVKQAESDERLGREAGATPDQQIDLLARLNAARTVEERERVASDATRVARLDAERAVAAAKDALARGQAALEDARQRLSKVNETTPISPWTMRLDWVRRVSQRDEISPGERADMAFQAESCASVLGVLRRVEARARKMQKEETDREYLERQQRLILPPKGHELRSASPGGQVMTTRPTPGGGQVIAMRPNP